MPTPDIFLSYSREDQAVARRFADALHAEGFNVWWDQALHPGEAFDEVTEKALTDARMVVVLWSPRSVSSRWVRAEAAHADESGTLVPVLIEACSVPVKFRLTQTADLTTWTGDGQASSWRAFVGSLRRSHDSPAQVSAAQSANPRQVPASRSPLLLAVGAAVLALVAAGWWFWRAEGPVVDGAGAAQAAGQEASVAIMPFANLTGDPELEYFGDGMAEELLNALQRIPGLKVPARTSSFATKWRNEEVRQIARGLGVRAVLEGSVRSAGETIRLTARLADGATGEQLWSEVYERPYDDVFRLQDELTRTIVQTLQEKLQVNITAPDSIRTRIPDKEAYRLFLRALSQSRKGGKQEMGESIALLDQVIRLDPGYAEAYSLRAVNKVIYLLRGYGGTLDLIRAAEDDARYALKLAPDLLESRAALSLVLTNRGNWAEAMQYVDGAEKTAINAPLLGFAESVLGYLARVDRYARESLPLAEVDPGFALQVVVQATLLGQTSTAWHYLDRALELGVSPTVPPLPMVRSMLAQRDHQVEQSIRFATEGLSPGLQALGGVPVVGQAIRAIGGQGDSVAASRALQELASRAGVQGMIQMENLMMLVWQTQLGNVDAAYEWAARMTEGYKQGIAGRMVLYWIWVDEMRPFREDPRFQKFTDDLGLLAYWRAHGAPDKCALEGESLKCH